MTMLQVGGIVTAVGFAGMCIFQLGLAFGAPIAHLSWGGRYSGILPRNLRIASFFSALLFVFGGMCALEQVNLLPVFNHPIVCRYTILGLGIIFAFSTMGNLSSRSPAEKKIMTPVSIFFSILCFIIALAA